jgi:periplasmic divalent cation tolerance protein
MAEYILVQWTTDDLKEAKGILSDLLESKCVACGMIYPGVTSIYQWKGKIEEAMEFVIVMKTREEYYNVIESYILENHSYIVAEVIAIPIYNGSKRYLDWIDQETLNSS